MKRFQFGLEKVLKLRQFRERETELELGKAVGALTALELRIQKTAEEKFRAMDSRFAQGRSINQIRSWEFYILRLDKTRDDLLADAAKAELVVEEARKIYIEASRDRKIIDKLKERRQKEYMKAMFKEEIKALDDISGGAAARKQTALWA